MRKTKESQPYQIVPTLKGDGYEISPKIPLSYSIFFPFYSEIIF
jgi:hypothetical protein